MYLLAPFWMLLVTFYITKADDNATAYEGNLIPCKQGWFLYDKKCYTILGESKGLNWKQAAVNCSLERGNLATVYSAELQEFLVAFLLLKSQKNVWIGLHDREEETEFTWNDHTPLNYTNWDENQPTGTGSNREKEDCVEMRFENWKTTLGSWNDQSCETEQPYFCQADESENVQSRDPRFCTVEDGEGWKYFHSCYHVVNEAKSWEDAERHCEEMFAGHLVAILDEKTEMFLNYIFPNDTENFWIGIKMRDQTVQAWNSGWHVIYNKWDHELKHFLEGTCGMMSKENMWTAVPCFRELPFICERSTDSAPTLKKAPKGWRCPDLYKNWVDLDGEYCYLFETNKSLTWYEANYDCGRKGGILASIRSEAESYIFHRHVKNTQERVFIGLHRSLSNKNMFEWADGNNLEYLNWDANEPNSMKEECGEIWTHSMKWNDIPCDIKKGYICAARKVPPNTVEINAPASSECVCTESSTVTKRRDETSAYASTDHICSSGMSAKTVTGIVVCIVLVAFLTGIIVYHYRNICDRRRNRYSSSSRASPSFNHISSEVILKPEELECRM